jgi:hypothetical protein
MKWNCEINVYDLGQRANYHGHQINQNYICSHKEQALKHYVHVLLET